MKKKILDFLIKIGKKCKPLTYPVMIVQTWKFSRRYVRERHFTY